ELNNPDVRCAGLYAQHAALQDRYPHQPCSRHSPAAHLTCLKISLLPWTSATQIEVEAATAATLAREEWLQESRERREVSRLNQHLARPAKLRDDAFATHHAAEESRRRFAQGVLRRSFSSDEMSGVDHVTLTRLQSFTM